MRLLDPDLAMFPHILSHLNLNRFAVSALNGSIAVLCLLLTTSAVSAETAPKAQTQTNNTRQSAAPAAPATAIVQVRPLDLRKLAAKDFGDWDYHAELAPNPATRRR